MKNIGILFLIAFIFFFLGQLLWTISLIVDYPLFGSKVVEEWILTIMFNLCSVFGIIASLRLYNRK